MTSVTLDNAHNVEHSATVALPSEVTPVGLIEAADGIQAPVNTTQPSYFQDLPPNPLQDFLSRPVRIHEYELLSTDSGQIDSFLPWDLFLSNPAVAKKLANYTYIRAELNLTFVITMPGGAYGRYVVSALPQTDATNYAAAADLYRQNVMQGDFFASIDCAEAEDVGFTLPWFWPVDYAATSDTFGETPADAWKVYTTTLKSIGTGMSGGVPVGRVKVYASLAPGYDLAVPHFQSKGKRKGTHDANKLLKHISPKAHATFGEGKASAMAGAISTAAAALAPVIGPMAMAVSGGAATAASVLSMFGFTRETHEVAPLAVVQRSVTNVAHLDGDVSAESASLAVSAQITIDPRVAGGSGEDALSCEDFFARWTMVHESTWSGATAAGTELFQIPVSPSFGMEGPGLKKIHLTTAGYYGLPFEYWRGDMEYLVVIPVSAFHRGCLQFLWTPLGSTTPVDDPTNVSFNIIHDVTTGSDIQLDIGYAREVPYVINRVWHEGFAIPPVGASNGFLSAVVVNQLTSPNPTPDTTITIFARAKNMSFQKMRTVVEFVNPINTAIKDYNLRADLAYQAGSAASSVQADDAIHHVLVPPSKNIPSEIYFGEDVLSLRALMQKPSQVDGFRLTTTVAEFTSLLTRPSPRGIGTEVKSQYSCATHNSLPFLGVAASERYAWLPEESIWLGASREPIPATTTVSPLAPMSWTGANQGYEVVVPWYRPVKFTSPLSLTPTNFTQIYGRTFPTSRNEITGVGVAEYYSYGPDIRVVGFRQLPLLVFDEVSPAPPVWFY